MAVAIAPSRVRLPRPSRRGSLRHAAAGPIVLVLGAAVALWLATGVSAAQAGVFLAYQATFVIGPGWLLYRLLRPGDGFRFRQLVVGWALGYVLEVLAFAATAAAHRRGLLPLYPVAVAAVAGVLWRRRVWHAARWEGP